MEWGLGHAGRMIPLARRLQALNNNILIGSGKEHLLFFKSEIPGLTYIDFPGFRIKYSRYLPQYLVILLNIPILIYHIIKEHERLKQIIKEYPIDIVISDNRAGLWNKKIKTVYITHLLRIPFPKPFRFLEFTGLFLNRTIIKRFSTCFIPDLDGDLNVSGNLSHGFSVPENVRYIGIMSRFTGIISEVNANPESTNYFTVILSGPEPQKGILKQKLTAIINSKGRAAIMFEGKPEKISEPYKSQNIRFYSHLPSAEMKDLILGSESIIARSGYTTIMELISLNRNALLIPTPGQTEQEYLAAVLSEKDWFKTVTQKNLNNDTEIPGSRSSWPPEIMKGSEILLEKALKELLEE